jgi:hypothetical protein
MGGSWGSLLDCCSETKAQVSLFSGGGRDFTISEQNDIVGRLAREYCLLSRLKTNSFPNREKCLFISNSVHL